MDHKDVSYELIEDAAGVERIARTLEGQAVIGLDTETTGLDPYRDKLLMVQIALPDQQACIIDARRVSIEPLRGVLENKAILKVAQNAKFEYEVLRQMCGITLDGIYDTMLVERLLTAGLRGEASLKAMATKYLGVKLDKEVRETFYKRKMDDDQEFTPEQLLYGALDAYLVLPIRDAQWERVLEKKLKRVAELEFACLPVIGEMELAGVCVDTVAWRTILTDAEVKRQRAEMELWRILEPTALQMTMFDVPAINMRSTKQLMEAFRKLGVDVENTTEATLLQHDHPAIKKLLEYRSYEKILSTYGESMLALINPVTGRIHPDFNQLGAEATGRMSASGPNLQNIPATSEFRKCFVAAPGYVFAAADYASQELRILGELSGDEAFAEAFRNNVDLHSATAANMFHIPIEEVTKDQRSKAKSISFGLAYGMGPGGLAGRLDISIDEARDLINKYFAVNKGVHKWLQRTVRESADRGYALSLLGRRRNFNMPSQGLPDEEYRKQMSAIERQSKNMPVQGLAADMTKLALIYLHRALKGYDAKIVLAVHDEIVVEVRIDQAEEVKEIVASSMVRAGEVFLKSVPTVAEAKISDRWEKG